MTRYVNMDGEESSIWRSRLSLITGAFTALCLFFLLSGHTLAPNGVSFQSPTPLQRVPTLHIVSDSTCAIGGLAREDPTRGWCEFISEFISIPVNNKALSGRSARTYTIEGDWNRTKAFLRKGDLVLFSMGINDEGDPSNDYFQRNDLFNFDDANATVEVLRHGHPEVVHTYQYYVSKWIADTRAAGAIPILASPIVLNTWSEDHTWLPGAGYWYPKLAQKVAADHNVTYVSHNNVTLQHYLAKGYEAVQAYYPEPNDLWHLGPQGALAVAECWFAALKCSDGPALSLLEPYFTKAKAVRPMFIQTTIGILGNLVTDRSAFPSLEVNTAKRSRIEPVASTSNLASIFQPKISFHWLPNAGASGRNATCLVGRTGSAALGKSKFAFFDLDGTLIKPKEGGKHPKSAEDWQFLDRNVPARIAKAKADGYTIVILSNQNHPIGSSRMKALRAKVPVVCSQLNVPLYFVCAFDKDWHRKPMLGMFELIESMNHDVAIDLANSFYVGDAAGRPNDHSDSDLKFALNVGLPFRTPEQFFRDDPKPQKMSVKGLNIVKDILQDTSRQLIEPNNLPIVLRPPAAGSPPDPPEVVLFVGFPALGKTTFFKRFFQPRSYVHVNQDTLGTADKCHELVYQSLKCGKSPVVDNTNRSSATRAHYIKIAKSLGLRVRCFVWVDTLQLAWHNNLYRAFAERLNPDETRRLPLPMTAFTSFKADFKAPSMDEGFAEIRNVRFIWNNTDPDALQRYSLWLEMGGAAHKSLESVRAIDDL